MRWSRWTGWAGWAILGPSFTHAAGPAPAAPAASTASGTTLYPLLLVHTLDGALHALERDSGRERWSMTLGGLVGRDEPDAARHSEQVSLTLPPLAPLYIVEPVGDGGVYVWSNESLFRLPLSLRKLVDLSPFTFHGDPEQRVYIGEKKTGMVEIDMQAGQLVRCWPETAAALDHCSEARLRLGTTAYSLSIYHRRDEELGRRDAVHHLHYETFAPADTLEAASATAAAASPPDGLRLLPFHDGRLLAVRNGRTVWSKDSLAAPALLAPVVGLWDIYQSRDGGLALARHAAHSEPAQEEDSLVYVGAAQSGNYFALGRASYPTVPDVLGQGTTLVGSHRTVGYTKEIGGVHILPLIDPPPAPPASASTSTSALLWAKMGLLQLVLLGLSVLVLALFWTTRLGARDLAGQLQFHLVSGKSGHVRIAESPLEKALPPIPFSTALSPAPMAEPAPKTGQEPEMDPTPDPVPDPDPDANPGPPDQKKRRRKLRGRRANQRLREEAHGLKEEILDHVKEDEGDPAPLDDAKDQVQLNSLTVLNEVIGFGSHGTVVFKGSFEGRAVAVKRMLMDFYTIASQEVSLLQQADDHPNVVRYFCKESNDKFLYIALELCPASLADLVENPEAHLELRQALTDQEALFQMTSGLAHLHRLKIVHRDIKPHNILLNWRTDVSTSDAAQPNKVRLLISDFGLCKRLDKDQSSFFTTAQPGGTIGWRAPEVLRGEVSLGEVADDSGVTGASSTRRLTRAIDIFALGCLFYYFLTRGGHPFGDRYEREHHILKMEASLHGLEPEFDDAHHFEARDLVRDMVANDPAVRPTAVEIMAHPFFWPPSRRLQFLVEASDLLEKQVKESTAEGAPPSELLARFESRFEILGCADWQRRLDAVVIRDSKKYRGYEGAYLRDLLRLIRNKRHHYQDLVPAAQKLLSPLPDGFLLYFTNRFPRLLLEVYWTVREASLELTVT